MNVFKIPFDFCSLLKITSDGHRKIVDTEYNGKDISSAADTKSFFNRIFRRDCQILRPQCYYLEFPEVLLLFGSGVVFFFTFSTQFNKINSIKQLLKVSVFIKVSDCITNLSLRQIIHQTLTSIILDIEKKASSNNCLLLYIQTSLSFLIGQHAPVNSQCPAAVLSVPSNTVNYWTEVSKRKKNYWTLMTSLPQSARK